MKTYSVIRSVKWDVQGTERCRRGSWKNLGESLKEEMSKLRPRTCLGRSQVQGASSKGEKDSDDFLTFKITCNNHHQYWLKVSIYPIDIIEISSFITKVIYDNFYIYRWKHRCREDIWLFFQGHKANEELKTMAWITPKPILFTTGLQ